MGQLAPQGPPTFGTGPSMPAPPPPPERRPGRTTRTLLITVGVLAVLLLLVSAGLVVSLRTDGTDVAATAPSTTAPPTTRAPTTPSTSAPGPSTPPTIVDPAPAGPPPTQEELDAEIAELSAFVERERGLPFLSPVEVTMADEATFDQLLFEDFDEDAAARAESERVLKALGLLPSDLDLEATMRQLLSGGVLGFYDPSTGQLVIRGEAITPYTRETIVHELTHALDDQHFELDRPEYDERDDEVSFGFSAVLEGNARRVEDAYVDAMSPEDQARRDLEEQRFAQATEPLLRDIPLVLLKLLQAPYDEGQVFVDGILGTGGQALLDAAIVDPPTTSTQVLHLEAYLQGITAVDVVAPQADGEIVDEGTFGELLTRLALEDGIDPNTATTAAEGWAGDRYVTWSDGEDGACIRVAYAMATPADLTELEEAYTEWAEPRGATVERSGDRLEVTSCSAAAAGTSPL